MLTISNLDYRIGARALFENASAQIAPGWKVGLIGRNGTGKSTLLQLIREEIEHPSPDSPIRLNKGARMGWVAQEVEPSDATILDVVLATDAERHALMQESETALDPDRIGEIHMRLAACEPQLPAYCSPSPTCCCWMSRPIISIWKARPGWKPI